MRKLLERKLFPFVIKPGRYAGGEPGQIVKNPVGRLQYLHAFPDKYEIGQSYIGLQTLYHIVNKDERFLCERVFAVDRDAEDVMRREAIPLFSLESSRPAGDFDVIGFTLTCEFVFTNVLAMLDLAGIPLRSSERTDGHPLIFAGGPAVYNPEPMADFIDLFFIGDAEEGLPDMLGVLHEMKDAPRSDKLRRLVKEIESVYVPTFYDGERKPLVDFAPPKIRARVIKELKPDYYPPEPILPLVETVHDHLGVEIMRGCPQGCRFCQAGPIYRPVRLRSQRDIVEQAEAQIGATGYEEIALLSLSTSDYPDIENLALTLSRRFESLKISLSLPSLRPGSISPALLEVVSRVRKAGLTIAPEAGTERLRQFIRKDISDEAVFETARLAFDKGWTTLKLYFMVGLPTETDDDLIGIADVIHGVHDAGRKYPGKRNLNVTLSPFVAEPHTPFQWDEMQPADIIEEKFRFIKNRCRSGHVHFKHHSTTTAVLQGILGRGGREMGHVILSAYRSGCRFDGWSEEFNPEAWFTALREHNIDIDDRLSAIPFGTALPWSHIEKGASENHLQQERQRTSAEMKEPRPVVAAGTGAVVERSQDFGRGKKKVASRSTASPTKSRARIRWAKSARYRYMSHLDNMRTLERALRRARLPVAYSQGFNPTMKLSFGPPLPLGFTSEAEYFDVTLDAPLVPSMIDKLKRAMPDGMDILEARVVAGKIESLSASLNRAVYTLPLEELSSPDDVIDKAGRILREGRLYIERAGKTAATVVDIRPAIFDIAAVGGTLIMTLGIGEAGYARPVEVLQLLDIGQDVKAVACCFHRQELYRVNTQGQKINAMDL
ncbi:MAG TPA: TIGR03960 family B12-binding radical SAM protein [Candidatus Deferrimicrobium sp.]|nr:TIGR03960 family B12-binding radical SAM protein [Candidatus Deferrimicrobium sp.]